VVVKSPLQIPIFFELKLKKIIIRIQSNYQ